MRSGAATIATLAALSAGCSGDLAPREDPAEANTLGRAPEVRRQSQPSLFGEEGITFGSEGVRLGGLLGGEEEAREGAIPVNRFLWRATLDTLSFLPLASTDPFTGVVATDWGATERAPGERFKVTAYMTDAELAASSLRVAVFRQVRGEDGAWISAPVDASTPRRIEDAILTRARQIRLAEAGVDNTG